MKRPFLTLAHRPNRTGSKRFTRRSFGSKESAVAYAEKTGVFVQIWDMRSNHRVY